MSNEPANLSARPRRRRRGALSLAIMLALALMPVAVAPAVAGESLARKLNFNPGWQVIRTNVAGAELPGYDASGWARVNCPHT